MSSNHKEHHSHTKSYLVVFVILLLLTALTVYTATDHDIHHALGKFAIYLAMFIATLKATLVALIFMHLKEDSNFNKLVFGSALVFLFIFIVLTLSDVLTRPVQQGYAKVQGIKEPEAAQLQKMNEWRKSSADRIEKGKVLYNANCLTCHGAVGQGDGPAAAAMNPKPRNLSISEGWKNGLAPAQVFKTLKEGLGQMPVFASLPAEDRWNLVHYVHTLSPNAPQDTAATLAAIGLGEGTDTISKDANEGLEVPISFAIERLLQEASKK